MSEMKKIKPSLSKGTRDFLPREVAKRNYIFDTIKSVFKKYGFEQIETPAIENLETLTGKYGTDAAKLIFKIRSNKSIRTKLTAEQIEKLNEIYKWWLPQKSEKALRYDLTVPLARYVVQHQDELAFPFKRFHIGPVWRADRPQKGRYQEFYQCDADIIGSNSVFNEIELTLIYAEVFRKLNIPVKIKINERGLLGALAITAYNKLLESGNQGHALHEVSDDFLNALDKIDKIGVDGAKNELVSKGYDSSSFDFVWKFIDELNAGNTPIKRLLILKAKRDLLVIEDTAREAFWNTSIYRLESIFEKVSSENIQFDLTLARGLGYYTGVIWEVVPNAEISIGSIGGGGRYDNLTEMFGGQNMSGVGISFGIERIYDVMEEMNLFPETIAQGVKVLFVPRDKSVEEFAFAQVQQLRDAGISAEIFLGNVKKQKHFNYVEQKNIAYMVEVGENEKLSGTFRLRNTKTRETENDLNLGEIQQRLR
jgi:histidyl-tRNA synthetase